MRKLWVVIFVYLLREGFYRAITPHRCRLTSLSLATGAYASTPAQVVARHVESMKVGKLQPIMDDYAADTVVVTPEGLVAGQVPAKGPAYIRARRRRSACLRR